MTAALLVGLVLSAAPDAPIDENARRDALTRFGVGVLRSRDDRPVEAVRQFEAAAKNDPAAAAPLRPLVNLYVEIGRDAAAIRTAETVLRLDPDDADTAHTLGQLLFESKRFADAARALKQAADSLRLADRPAKRLGAYRDLAKACDAAGDPAGAEDALRKAAAFAVSQRCALLRSDAFPTAAELDRELGVVHEKLGQALSSRKKFAEAEAAFATAAKLFADKSGANAPQAAARLEWNLSTVAAGRGDTAAAVDHLLKFLALRPQNAEPYERLAELLTKAGRPAAPVLARLAEQSPKTPAVRWVHAAEVGRTNPGRANLLFRETARSTADPAFFRIAVRHYRDANLPAELLTLIDELYRVARVKGADDEDAPLPPGKKPPVADPVAVARAQALTAAVRADREASRQLVGTLTSAGSEHSDDTWELLTSLAEREGRTDLAERAARQLWAAHSGGRGNDTSGFRRLYDLLFRQRKWQEALDLCDTAGRAGNFALGYFRAVPLAELGRGREALAALDSALPNLKDAFGGRLHRARVLNILDRHREAAAECRDVMKDAPTPDDVRRVRYVLSEALLGLKDHAGAEAELRAVLDDNPDDVLALNNLGYNLADQGRKLDEAEELVCRAIQLDRDARARAGDPEPENGVYSDSLGWVLFRRGKLTDARAVLETAVSLPDSGADAVVWDHLGDTAFRQGDHARARQAWTRAIELYANSHQGRQAGRRVEAARKLRLVP